MVSTQQRSPDTTPVRRFENCNLSLYSESSTHRSGDVKTFRHVLPRHVLLVDDDRDIRYSARLRLEAAGFRTTQAADGIDAMEAIQLEMPHVILLDIRMPRMNGLETMDALKSNPETSHIPIVALSASMRDIDASLDHGATIFLTKPFDARELVETVQGVTAQGF